MFKEICKKRYSPNPKAISFDLGLPSARKRSFPSQLFGGGRAWNWYPEEYVNRPWNWVALSSRIVVAGRVMTLRASMDRVKVLCTSSAWLDYISTIIFLTLRNLKKEKNVLLLNTCHWKICNKTKMKTNYKKKRFCYHLTNVDLYKDSRICVDVGT